jgi:hypothetical protein
MKDSTDATLLAIIWDYAPAMTNTALRLAMVLLLCTAIVGCVGVASSVVTDLITLPIKLALRQTQRDRCGELTAKGITITEPAVTTIPTDEGEIQMFEPAVWRSEFEGGDYPQEGCRERALAGGRSSAPNGQFSSCHHRAAQASISPIKLSSTSGSISVPSRIIPSSSSHFANASISSESCRSKSRTS